MTKQEKYAASLKQLDRAIIARDEAVAKLIRAQETIKTLRRVMARQEKAIEAERSKAKEEARAKAEARKAKKETARSAPYVRIDYAGERGPAVS